MATTKERESGIYQMQDDGSLEPIESNGKAGEAHAASHASHEDDTAPRRRADPKTWPALVWRAVQEWGIGVLFALAALFILWKVLDQHQKFAEEAHKEFQAALSENTKALKDMTAEQKTTNDALIKMDAKLDAHLAESDRENHHR
jgi:hypothetical protein